MHDVETVEERELYEAAYEQWVAEARETGRNTEPETFRAGWLAGLAYVKSQRSE
jgi:hypothetical protein